MIVVCWPVCDKETQSLCLRAELICNTCIYMISFCVIVFIEQFPDYLVLPLYTLKLSLSHLLFLGSLELYVMAHSVEANAWYADCYRIDRFNPLAIADRTLSV